MKKKVTKKRVSRRKKSQKVERVFNDVVSDAILATLAMLVIMCGMSIFHMHKDLYKVKELAINNHKMIHNHKVIDKVHKQQIRQ